jgi:glycosyltransferase involved in cell wall biosynthesis
VATAVGGTPELVTDPRYGLLVPPGDATALADALGEALDRKWDAAALRSRAEEFAWPRIVEQLREVYREVAGG